MSTQIKTAASILFLCTSLAACFSSEQTDATSSQPEESGSTGGTTEPTDLTLPGSRLGTTTTLDPGCADCPSIPTFERSTNTTVRTVWVADYTVEQSNFDHLAIQQAIDAAGVGGRVIFESGREYTICKMLLAKPDQIWQPSSNAPATLKRCTTPVATLTADTAAGATAVLVSDASKFEPGMWISPVRASGNDFYAGELTHHPVTEASGEVIRFYNGLEQAYQAGDKLVTSFAMIQDASGTLFEGLVFDGNAAGNDHFVSWARHSTLWLRSSDSAVRHSRFINAQGDAITVQGRNNLIEYNEFYELNGAAMHFSAAKQTAVRGNHLIATNQQADRVAHAEAAATWSLGNEDILMEANCIRDIPVAGFGIILVHGSNYGADIRDNQICRVESLLDVVTVSDLDIDLLFTGNRVEKARQFKLQGDDATLTGVEISGNRFDDTGVLARNVDDLVIHDNAFFQSADADLKDGDESLYNKLASIHVRGGVNISIARNSVASGRKGIQVYNWLNRASDVIIQNNTLAGQYESGLVIGNLASITSSNPDNSDFAGISATQNTITSNVLQAGQSAVELGRRAAFSSNCVESNGVGVRVYGYPDGQNVPNWNISDNWIDSQSESLFALEPFTRGPRLYDNRVSGDVAEALLENNPLSVAPEMLSETCE